MANVGSVGELDESGGFYPDPELDDELRDILYECYNNTALFAKTFFPEDVALNFTSLHHEILRVIDSAKPRSKVVIAAPRGIGKTTLATLFIAKQIVYRASRFVCYVSKTETHAIEQTEAVKEMLLDPVKSALFGDVKAREVPGVGKEFSKKSWIANDFTAVVPRGARQQIRGLKWRRFRPDLFLFDDLEDDILIQSEEQRKLLKRWFFGAAIKAHAIDSPWKLIYIDTIKHEDALIVDLLSLPGWEKVELSACTEDYKTLVPEFLPQDELDEEIEEHRSLGIMDVFLRERMCKVVSSETATFKEEFFKYYDERDLKFQERIKRGKIVTFILVDPAKTAAAHAADVAIGAVAVDYETSAFYIRDIDSGHYHPDETYNKAIDMAVKYNAPCIGVEVTGLNEFITYPFMDMIIRRSKETGKVFRLYELKARRGQGEFSGVGGGKKGRIAGLVPYYRSGLVYHNKAVTAVLEQQLLSFPSSKKWDVMDMVSYILELMAILNQYVGVGEEDGMESWEEVKEEYRELEEEMGVYEDEWIMEVDEVEIPQTLRGEI